MFENTRAKGSRQGRAACFDHEPACQEASHPYAGAFVHLVTQKFVDTQVYAECGLEVSLMPSGAYEKEGAGSQRVQASRIGTDFPGLAAALDREAAARGLAVVQVFVNAGAPGAAFAVEGLCERGFFLGGLVPIWFGTDGLLLQELYVAPGFEAINLYSARGKALLEFVRADYGRVRR